MFFSWGVFLAGLAINLTIQITADLNLGSISVLIGGMLFLIVLSIFGFLQARIQWKLNKQVD